MSSKIATPKQTGGGGFNYEDKVGAYFLVCMLQNQSPFKSTLGLITRIDFQQAAKGWAFDDLLVTLRYHKQQFSVGVSVKSNQQFSGEAATSSLVSNIWEQYLELNSKVFNPSTDYMCLAQPPLKRNIAGNLSTLIALAINQDPIDFEQNIKTDGYTSEEKVKLYNSFALPVGFKDQTKDKVFSPGYVLSRFQLLEFDFENVVSQSENNLISLCSNIIESHEHTDSVRLYERLQGICKDNRPVGGFITLPKLIELLKYDFDLKPFSNFFSDFEKIRIASTRAISTIKTTIAKDFIVDREVELGQLHTILMGTKACAVLAPSGHGKSSLVKLYVERYTNDTLVLWANANQFETQLSSKLMLSHGFADIFANNVKARALIVIDGLERFYSQEQIEHLVSFVNEIITIESSLNIVFTCIEEDYDIMLSKLRLKNLPLLDITTMGFKNAQLDLVTLAKRFPDIMDLFRDNRFRSLISNFKIFDALAITLNQGVSNELTGKQITESDLIDFVWKNQIESGTNGIMSTKVIEDMANTQANSLQMAVSMSEISFAASAALPDLINRRICFEEEDYIYFHHDLYGDWARYKIIRSRSKSIKPFLLSLDLGSPLWARAIRQYGIFQIESKQQEKGWLNLFQQFDEKSHNERLIQSILLESIIFSTNSEEHLSSLRETLFENDGILLKRLLETFLIKASRANPNVLEVAKTLKGVSITEASVLHRIPIYSYWVSMLSFINEYHEDIIKLDYHHSALIARDWLTYTPKGSIFRKEMAELALILSSIASSDRRFSYKHDNDKKSAFEGLVRGYMEIPETAKQMLLTISKRTKPEAEHIKIKQLEEPPKSYRFHNAEKWTHGPYGSVDTCFIEIIINGNAIYDLFDANPNLANELLLAVLIEKPKNEYHEHARQETLNLNIPRNWSPSFYKRGPFLAFLQISSTHAVEGIVNLVNFATEQWLSSMDSDEVLEHYVELEIDGDKKKYYGDSSVYFWYRDIGIPPSTLVSALMAVEKFLHDEKDQTALLNCISLILRKSNSIAFVGVLISVGKARPDLFRGILMPCLKIMNFYRWEKNNLVSFQLDQYGLNNLPSSQREEAHNWNKEFHRTHSLDDIMIFELMNNSKQFQPIYKTITETWEKDLAAAKIMGGHDIYYDRLVSFFKPENYVTKKTADGIAYWEYTETKELKDRLMPIRDEINAKQIQPSAFMLSQFLEKDRTLSLKEIQQLWIQVEDLKKWETEDAFKYFEDALSSILGGYLVLLKFKSIWDTEYPEYWETITSYCEAIFGRIEREKISNKQLSIPWNWTQFLPKLVAHILWEVFDSRVRKWITLITANLHVQSVEALFKELSQILKWNDPKFISIQNYVLKLASLNAAFKRDRSQPADNRIIKLHDDFTNEVGEQIPLNWAEVRNVDDGSDSTCDTWERVHYKEYPLLPGFDLSLLKASYNCLPHEKLPTDSDEQNHILFLWRQALGQVVYQLGPLENATEEIEGYPGDYDRWILSSIPNLIGENCIENYFDDFCEPIIRYGYIAGEWVEQYCSNILLHTLDKQDKFDLIIPRWRNVIKYSLAHDNWKNSGNIRQRFLPLSLFLLTPRHVDVWEYDYSVFTTKASSTFTEFFAARKVAPPVIKALCSFSKTTSGQQFLEIALGLVDYSIRLYSELSKQPLPVGYVRQEFYATKEVASLVSYAWGQHQPRVIMNGETFSAYKNIVVFLASIQNPIGIELHSVLLKE